MFNIIYLQYEDESWHLEYIPCSFCNNDLDYWLHRYESMFHCKIIDYEIEK